MTAALTRPGAELHRAEQARLELNAALTNLGLRPRTLSVQATGAGPATLTLGVDPAGANTIASILAAHAEQADQ